MQIVLYVVIGLAVGGISGVMGIGGGVLLVPALVWLCRMDPHRAAGTTLAILIPPIGLPAAWRAYNMGHVDLPAALWIAGAFCLGAFASRGLVENVPDFWFRLGFGILMIFVAMRLIVDSDSEAASAAAGLMSAGLAMVIYWGLKSLGKRNLQKPGLRQKNHERYDQPPNNPDYQI
ncbi:MAG: sulfite exporter TauE/SafE family protein [Planctomycetes bacterium]|nr:sulfite exporter TauE/SafE family protein [Planctomycetota bacterium]